VSAFLLYAAAAEKNDHLDAARQALIQYAGLADTAPAPLATRIAALSLRLNDPATAVHWFGRAAAAAPADVRVLAALADAHVRNGDPEAARAVVARALDRDPHNAQLASLARRLREPPG
jgi:Flp pilus assembly protein TadD